MTAPRPENLPPPAFALALASLPGAGPVGLARLLAQGGPRAAWEAVLAGADPRPPASNSSRRTPWPVAARRFDLAGAWLRCRRAGIEVTWLGDDRYPADLVSDPLPPAVLFWRGRLETTLAARRVAVVGTRQATPAGRSVAYQLGRELAAAGVTVVSGLALGIDGAAHRGALASGRVGSTLGVAGSGPDRVYPRAHADLFAAVIADGALLSETPPGQPAQKWRFPARNRLIAALSELVVVVESHAGGGSWHTVEAALERGIDVRAVPGSVCSPASDGTNQLIFDGAAPVRDGRDILEAMGIPAPPPAPADRTGDPQAGRPQPTAGHPAPDRAGPPSRSAPAAMGEVAGGRGTAGGAEAARPVGGESRPSPAEGTASRVEAGDAAVLDVLGSQPISFNSIVERSGRGVAEVAAVLQRLAEQGVAVEERGWWQRTRP